MMNFDEMMGSLKGGGSNPMDEVWEALNINGKEERLALCTEAAVALPKFAPIVVKMFSLLSDSRIVAVMLACLLMKLCEDADADFVRAVRAYYAACEAVAEG